METNQAPFDSPFEPRTLVEKSAYIKRNAIIALLLSILSLTICGFLGIFSFLVSSSVIETIDYYSIELGWRGVALAAKIISIGALVLWIGILIVRVFLWQEISSMLFPAQPDFAD